MLDSLAPQIAQLVEGALDAISASLQATSTVVIDKKVVDSGPDHYARLTGAKRLLEFTLAGRPRPEKKAEARRGFTMQEIEAAMAANQEEARQRGEQTH